MTSSAHRAAVSTSDLCLVREDIVRSTVTVLEALYRRDRADRLAGHPEPCLGPYSRDVLNLLLYNTQVISLPPAAQATLFLREGDGPE